MGNDTERRSHPRVRVKLPVVKITGNGLVEGEIRDLGLGGAFICCPEMANSKDEFYMVVSTRGRLIPIIGEVVWQEVNNNRHKKTIPRMGVRFKQILNGDRSFLRQIIASHYSNRVPSWLPRIFRTNG